VGVNVCVAVPVGIAGVGDGEVWGLGVLKNRATALPRVVDGSMRGIAIPADFRLRYPTRKPNTPIAATRRMTKTFR